MDFCKWTDDLWRVYFSSSREEQAQALSYLAADCSIIGTGAHELYDSAQDFALALGSEMSEHGNLPFQRKDYWCQQRLLGEDAALTYGGIHIYWESTDGAASIDIDSRFSIVFQYTGGAWRIVHLHHSVPDPQQLAGEFYARTLLAQVQEARTAAEKMERLAQQDSLTGLANLRAFRSRWAQQPEPGWLFLLDVDDFKRINDVHGHIAGNHALIHLASTLRAAVRERDLVCRPGGDEFLLLCPGLMEAEHADRFARRVLERVQRQAEGLSFPLSVSIGGTAVTPGEPWEQVIDRADQALYRVKNSTKHGFENQ